MVGCAYPSLASSAHHLPGIWQGHMESEDLHLAHYMRGLLYSAVLSGHRRAEDESFPLGLPLVDDIDTV